MTDVLDAKLKPARISVEVLNELRDQCNHVVLSRAVSCGDAALDGELWSKTLEEVVKGHLLGPFEVDQLPAGAFVNNRFPIKQADKVRPIDNYSSSLVNDTVTVSEKPVVHSVDEIGAVATRLATLAKKRNLKKLFGKTADLKGACRQLALADDSMKYSYLAVFSPEEKKAKIFHQVAVPFGSTKAVYFFLRVARALWTVSCCWLWRLTGSQLGHPLKGSWCCWDGNCLRIRQPTGRRSSKPSGLYLTCLTRCQVRLRSGILTGEKRRSSQSFMMSAIGELYRKRKPCRSEAVCNLLWRNALAG